MPVWDFECTKCGVLYKDQLVSRETTLVCPDCGEELKRLLGAPCFKVKGANAAGGYGTCVGDIEKFMGRPMTQNDLDD